LDEAGVFDNLSVAGIVVTNLTLRYGSRTIFEHLNFTIDPGHFVVLLGGSGIGKTSLLKIMAGLSGPTAGSVTTTSGRSVSGHVAYMAQTDLLYPWLSASANVSLGARLRRQAPDQNRALALLERVGLADRARAMPGELSAGMRQRVAIARTLYEDRPIVLMDEPFSALDTLSRARMQELAAELLAGRTTLMITHDPFEACRLGHHLVIMSGTPAEIGPPIAIAGATPRAADDPALLRTQGHLMALLMPRALP
jgi:putative hydroxymethylpyrimidine transport system ATP-binding protein